MLSSVPTVHGLGPLYSFRHYTNCSNRLIHGLPKSRLSGRL